MFYNISILLLNNNSEILLPWIQTDFTFLFFVGHFLLPTQQQCPWPQLNKTNTLLADQVNFIWVKMEPWTPTTLNIVNEFIIHLIINPMNISYFMHLFKSKYFLPQFFVGLLQSVFTKKWITWLNGDKATDHLSLWASVELSGFVLLSATPLLWFTTLISVVSSWSRELFSSRW